MPGIDLSEQSIKMGACLKLISDWRRQDTYNNAKQKLRNWAGGFCVLEMAINSCPVSVPLLCPVSPSPPPRPLLLLCFSWGASCWSLCP